MVKSILINSQKVFLATVCRVVLLSSRLDLMLLRTSDIYIDITVNNPKTKACYWWQAFAVILFNDGQCFEKRIHLGFNRRVKR